jgi:hypothetical protein
MPDNGSTVTVIRKHRSIIPDKRNVHLPQRPILFSVQHIRHVRAPEPMPR